MSKNYMPEVAKMLGVELGERFKIRYGTGAKSTDAYYFDGNGLHPDAESGVHSSTKMRGLLNGECEIIKLPWKPKDGDEYYYVNQYGDINACPFDGDVLDLAMLYIENCFRTEAEAEAHKDEIMAKYREVMD